MAKEQMPLHPIEKSILLVLTQENDIELSALAKAAKLSLDQTRRAIQWLKAKNLIEVKESERLGYLPGDEGKNAIAQGLPERRLVRTLEQMGGKGKLADLASALHDDFSIALGKARSNGWIKMKEGGTIELNPGAYDVSDDEKLLTKLGQHIPSGLEAKDLTDSELQRLDVLSKRYKGLIEQVTERVVLVKLNPAGQVFANQLSTRQQGEEIEEITPALLQSGSWKGKEIRAIDVTSPTPRVYPGRRHPLRVFMDEVRAVFVSMGFEEITGSYAQSCFWNFDALFIPQQHSARELQDTYYISNMKADLSRFKEDERHVREAHETGDQTGSSGWQYKWQEEEARRVVLRTHTTAVTIRYLAEKKPSEARVFTVSKVFRNEKPTYKNNPEFYQVDGVMVERELSLRTLMAVISKFYSKLGFQKVKFWPTYFPYTEPSLQTMVYLEKSKRWMELGGMGVFRPEVCLPLGIKNPVLAWGLGLDRLVMLRYEASDIRQLFGSNLGWLRSVGIERR